MLFYVAIHKDPDSVYGVTVPALPGCFSFGETLEEASQNVREAIQFHIEGYLDDRQEPEIKHLSLDELQGNPDYQGALWVGLEVDVSGLTLKPERFNVSWPKYLLNRVDHYVQDHHDNRSNFLAKAAVEKLEKEIAQHP